MVLIIIRISLLQAYKLQEVKGFLCLVCHPTYDLGTYGSYGVCLFCALKEVPATTPGAQYQQMNE